MHLNKRGAYLGSDYLEREPINYPLTMGLHHVVCQQLHSFSILGYIRIVL